MCRNKNINNLYIIYEMRGRYIYIYLYIYIFSIGGHSESIMKIQDKLEIAHEKY